MKLSELLYENEYECEKNLPSELSIEQISTSIDDIDKNSMFILNESINFNIENIIKYIENKSPKIIVCNKKYKINSSESYILYVKNTRIACSYIYSRFYKIDFSAMEFIGITGTNGKTTTASMIEKILLKAGNKTGFIGSGRISADGKCISEKNYSMTTPDPNLLYKSIKTMQDIGCKYIVIEVSSHSLYFEKTAPIHFKLGIFTNLSAEHMDFHKSLDEYFSTKVKLFDNCDISLFNRDDEYGKKAANIYKENSYSVGINEEADAMAREIRDLGFDGSEYIYKEKNALIKIQLKLPGIYNIYNSLIAIKAAMILEINQESIKSAINSIEKIDGRFEIMYSDVTVIIDYAHTSYAFETFLKTLNSIKKREQNLIIVFGCGGERDVKKRSVMGRLAEKYADFSIITSDNSRMESPVKIISEILEGFQDEAKRIIVTSRESAIEYAILSAPKNSIIAIIGKGHERYNIDREGYHEFDERKIISEALLKRKRNEETGNANKNGCILIS